MKKLWIKLRLWRRPMIRRYEKLSNELIKRNTVSKNLYLCILVDHIYDDLLSKDLEYRFRNMELLYPEDYEKTLRYRWNLYSWSKGGVIWRPEDFENRYNFLMSVIRSLES